MLCDVVGCVGFDIASKVEKGEATWETLWERMDFYNTYKYFIYVTCHARTEVSGQKEAVRRS